MTGPCPSFVIGPDTGERHVFCARCGYPESDHGVEVVNGRPLRPREEEGT